MANVLATPMLSETSATNVSMDTKVIPNAWNVKLTFLDIRIVFLANAMKREVKVWTVTKQLDSVIVKIMSLEKIALVAKMVTLDFLIAQV